MIEASDLKLDDLYLSDLLILSFFLSLQIYFHFCKWIIWLWYRRCHLRRALKEIARGDLCATARPQRKPQRHNRGLHRDCSKWKWKQSAGVRQFSGGAGCRGAQTTSRWEYQAQVQSQDPARHYLPTWEQATVTSLLYTAAADAQSTTYPLAYSSQVNLTNLISPRSLTL